MCKRHPRTKPPTIGQCDQCKRENLTLRHVHLRIPSNLAKTTPANEVLHSRTNFANSLMTITDMFYKAETALCEYCLKTKVRGSKKSAYKFAEYTQQEFDEIVKAKGDYINVNYKPAALPLMSSRGFRKPIHKSKSLGGQYGG